VTGDASPRSDDSIVQASGPESALRWTDDERVAPEHVEKLRDILALLDRSHRPSDMDIPGFRLHPLKGALKGHWAVWVSGNWRVTFRFEEGEAVDLDYLDYH
jgi:toxin HigB-1